MWLCWIVPIYIWPDGTATIYEWTQGTRMSESGGEIVPMLKVVSRECDFIAELI